jgi:FKBP-type peptidyl-prolyl cis-trans isomerase 2
MVSENAVFNHTGAVVAERDPMKFKNGDISLDDAVEDLVKGIAAGEEFTVPNADMLIQAVMDTPW